MKEKAKDKRLREGCLVCKLRHIKCDGTRPQCNNCRDAKRQCKGFPPLPKGTALAENQLSKNTNLKLRLGLDDMIRTRPQWSSKEMRSFSFGLQRTIPQLTIYFDSDFWGYQIPKLAHSIPAIRYALNALASFHERSKPGDISPISPGSTVIPAASISIDKFFLQQYNKAIDGLSWHFTDEGLPKQVCILVCCALFVCLEGLHGRHRAMVNHLKNGLKVFHEWVSTKEPDTQFAAGSIEATVYETFQRMDFHAAAFLDGHIPQMKQLTVLQKFPPSDMFKPVFTSVPQARSHLDTLYGRTFLFLKAFNSATFEHLPYDKIPPEITEKHQLLTIVSASAAKALEKYNLKNELNFSSREKRSITLLRIRIKIISIFILKWPYEHLPHDEIEPEYQSIIDLSRLMIREHVTGTPIPSSDSEHSSPSSGEESSHPNKAPESVLSIASNFDEPPLFTLEVGLLPILYYIAVGSSTASIRMEAIQLLRSANLREGLWSSNRAANMAAQRLMDNGWQRCRITAVEMSELTKRLWTELRDEEEDGVWV